MSGVNGVVVREAAKYGLVAQLRRCAVSIPSNIAEGYRRGREEYVQFLRVSFSSCGELEPQLSLSSDLGYVSEQEFRELHLLQDEVSRLLGAMIRGMDARK
ncbi:MAG: four helix bundle protein [Chloroflexota bacterium]